MGEQTTTVDETATAVAGDEAVGVAGETATGQRRGRRVWLWPSVAITAAIVAGAGVYLAQRSSGTGEARAAYSEAVTVNEQARTALQAAADGVGFTAEQCEADGGAPADCQALFRAVEAARAGLAEPFEAADAKGLDADSARSQAENLRAKAADFETQAAQIKDATGKLNGQFEAATASYLNGDAASFAASCETATANARVVEGLAGEADTLSADCKALAASGKGVRLSVLKEKAAALQGRVDALNGKVAAAQAPAPSAPAAVSGGGSEALSDYSDSGYSATENGGSSSWSDDSYEAPAAPAPALAPEPAPADNGGWVDTSTGGNFCAGTDSNGNSWTYECP